MALYVVVTPYGSKNHLAYGSKNWRVTWCGQRYRNITRRVKFEMLSGGSTGINENPVTCELCIKRLMGKAHNQHQNQPIHKILRGDYDLEHP